MELGSPAALTRWEAPAVLTRWEAPAALTRWEAPAALTRGNPSLATPSQHHLHRASQWSHVSQN
jgi:acyl-CoA reductase-like NAD-dependent aldehyde dehydrogenase